MLAYRETRFNNLLKSLPVSSNLLTDQYLNQLDPQVFRRTAVDYYDSNPLPPVTRMTASVNLRYSTKKTSRLKQQILIEEPHIKKTWIIEKNMDPNLTQTLYKRLNHMRNNNEALENFSLSKLLSKIKLLKDQVESPARNTTKDNGYVNANKITLKQTLFNFKESKEHQKSAPKSPDKEQETQKIFLKYYCPPSSYRDPQYFKDISPEQRYVYKNGKKVECKRIHNFYTSEKYKRGFSRYYKKIGEDELPSLATTIEKQ